MKLVKDSTLELRKKFTLKYAELVNNFPEINEIQHREFAFLSWDKSFMIRHKGFMNFDLFKSELKGAIPKHVYYSAALYHDPANKIMTDKGWFGCDFVVDIDSDHMDLPCQKSHDYFICTKCDFISTQEITKCPECESSIRKQLWLCDDCLKASKIEVLKLIDDFLPDFGFTRKNVLFNFSGHRGYHVHLRDDYIRTLSSNERRQIVDYITGTNFNPNDYFNYKASNGYFMGSSIDDPGWKGRIARTFHKILTSYDSIDSFDKDYGHYMLDTKIKKFLFESPKREQLINQLINKNPKWTIMEFGKSSWEKIKNFLLKISRCDIDVPVSIDTHRLIRAQGSINGKTGFIVKPLDYYELVNFEPLVEPIIFSFDKKFDMKVEIITPKCPEIRIKDEFYGPYEKYEKIDVPEAVGVFLVCKGVAQIV